MKTIYLFLIAILVGLTACEKEIHIDIPDNDSKLVVSCHLGSGKIINVDVSASIPLYAESSGEIKNVDNALVRISADQSNWQIIPYNVTENRYVLPLNLLPIVEGETYYIEVSAAGYKTVNSKTTIPVYQTIYPTLVSLDTIAYDYGKEIAARFKFSDIPNQSNYYAVKAYVKANNQWSEMDLNGSGAWVFSDRQEDGREFVINFTKYYDFVCDSLRLEVFQTNEAFYQFEYSMYLYSPDSPFSEPTPLYTNITNGLGVLSGYTTREYLFSGELFRK